MTDTIRPALTREEWVEFERFGWEATVLRDGYPGDNNYRFSAEATTRGLVRVQVFGMHALAALALHGQPFGFRREDVTFLGEMIETDTDPAFGMAGFNATLRSLVARIEALLPPEAK